MRSIPIASLTLLVLTLTVLVGCPFFFDGASDGNGDNTGPTTIAGTWTGTLASTRTFSYPSFPGIPVPGTRELTITFDSEYIPSSLPIWGFSLAFDQTTTKSAVGDSETFNFDANNPPGREVTLVVTITEATYGETGATVVMDLQHSAESDELTEEGTGTMTIQATVDVDGLTFSGVAEYTVTQTTAQGSFEATETINCTGTLTTE